MKPESTKETVKPIANKNSIINIKGLVALSDKYSKNDFVRFYNEDGSLWYEFTFYYDDSDGKFEYANENFNPFAFHPDNFLLALKSTGEDGKRYEVVVNEETGLKKFVNKDDPVLKFVTWEEHLLKAFAVDFNKNENTLRETPGGELKKVDLAEKVSVHPVEVKGEWLKVEWDNPDKTKNNGWVKWKENERLLIEIFYFA